jgi:cobalamin-dependent methionine synthase I
VFEKSRTLIRNNEMLHGYVYDIYGSLAVENAMEQIQNNLKIEMAKTGSGISNRYSPGYCGWMVSEQKKLFSLLPPGFCGITLSDSCLMQPIKSISGFIGIGPEIHHKAYTCEVCDSSQCLYRNLKHNV